LWVTEAKDRAQNWDSGNINNISMGDGSPDHVCHYAITVVPPEGTSETTAAVIPNSADADLEDLEDLDASGTGSMLACHMLVGRLLILALVVLFSCCDVL
jgi:hypothetical protein